jgi:hypothetical protein
LLRGGHSLVIGGGISVGGMGDVPGGETYSFNPGAAGGISTTPNVLGPWAPSAPGRLASGDNVLALGNLGDIGGGVWDSPNLVPGVGRIALLMDIDWINLGPAADRMNIVGNIELYLRPGPQVPEPTTLVLLGVGLLGTGRPSPPSPIEATLRERCERRAFLARRSLFWKLGDPLHFRTCIAFSILAQGSRSSTVRLKTSLPGVLSGSTQK